MSCDFSSVQWPSYLDEYEKLVNRMSTPRVIIDNEGASNETRLMIDSARKHEILLEAVQVLSDLNLSIKKAYICSDGRWFMDVFHVTDVNGNKLNDESVLGSIEQSLETVHYRRPTSINGQTALELTGTDRVGLLSEILAVLSTLSCSVVDAKLWTNNGRIASIIYLKDDQSGSPINDEQKLKKIEAILQNVLKGHDDDIGSSKTSVLSEEVHADRRLHQLMYEDGDFERRGVEGLGCSGPSVSVRNYLEKDYSVVNVQCRDRNKLLFDVVCAMTDMKYVVFHATVNTLDDTASMEFFIRHSDGTTISSEVEKESLILCLSAAIERRTSKGLRFELHAPERKDLLVDVTRVFRENGLNVTRAEISTARDMARNIFYVTDAVGNSVDPKTVEMVRKRIGFGNLSVTGLPSPCGRKVDNGILVSIGSMVRRNLNYLGLIKS